MAKFQPITPTEISLVLDKDILIASISKGRSGRSVQLLYNPNEKDFYIRVDGMTAAVESDVFNAAEKYNEFAGGLS